MLRSEIPLMFISNTKDIFLKRLKRMKKMVAADCSSDESSSEPQEPRSEPSSFSSSVFIHSVATSELEVSEREDSLLQTPAQKGSPSTETDF
jgi:hypothetical protein